MRLDHPVTDLIRARTSKRKYQPRPIEDALRRTFEASLAEARPCFGSRVRFRLVAATDDDRDALRGLGTYGFIRNAPGFVVGAVQPGPMDMVDYGYAMEALVLRATDLDLGTCWLGGTFTRSEFSRKIGARGDETVPAVVAIGHATSRRGAFEKLIRAGAGSKKRRPWEAMFFSGAYGVPLSQATAGPYAEPLEMVRLGPSASNKQPWRVIKERGEATFHFVLERTPGYGKGSKLPVADLQKIDMGIALCHFELTAREAGLEGEWSIEPPAGLGALPEHAEHVATWKG